ncbi:putative short-subunit dehydrogenase-like oxidoreductase (DUF2520 family) [Filimonas zeae]|uniref:DUF2520 domain-containing protein n=1 Tax=Filimonas zeae TaxID=1737353 RepID=A0A917IT17_9BACT|nr:Rossmann-like and DUF2520 domain-containing protein [Filimonas zeae]MDR6338279.1 putative short-subunit dehydrogenase-like oxidoreductase (DUF2520 family) [Filimonas zeae]GGH62614.1 hypothetical protein GCM10011379_12740 [Filimonas zeae]
MATRIKSFPTVKCTGWLAAKKYSLTFRHEKATPEKYYNMKIVLIGSGNVNTVLGRRMVKAGHSVLQVISRNLDNASKLAAELDATAADSMQYLNGDADLYMVSVSDTALPQVVEEVLLHEQLVVHTTGAAPLQILKNSSANYGVLYPLQSLRKNMDSEPVIPLFTDANTPEAEEVITRFAQSLSPITGHAGDAERLKLHVGAVLASNFTNFLYMQAEEFCKKENIGFEALLPLIQETAARLQHYSPASVQTGPAVRRDMVTIEKHLQVLKPYPELTDLYKHLTGAIISH